MKYLTIALMAGVVSVAGANESRAAAKQDSAKPAAMASAEDDGYKCERRKKLGTNIFERICTTQAQRDEARERAQQELTKREH